MTAAAEEERPEVAEAVEEGGMEDPVEAVARWAVAELKIVHSGRPNQHLHDALDAMLAGMPAD